MGFPTQPTRQFALNVVATLRADRRQALGDLLERISRQTLYLMEGAPSPDTLFDFSAIGSLHYARCVVLPGRGDAYQSPGGGTAPAGPDMLALNAWYDGPEGEAGDETRARADFVRSLLSTNRRAIDAIFSCCEGYPEEAPDDAIARYLLDRAVPAAATYFGSPGRSRGQILAEADLARRVRAIVDGLRAEGPLPSAGELRRRILGKLGDPPPPFPPQRRAVGSLAAQALVRLPLLPALIAGLPWLRYRETHDPAFAPVFSQPEREHTNVTTSGEDLFFQNALSNVVEVKTGWFRRSLLRVVLSAIDVLARDYFVQGKLGELASIHAAHWYLLDGGRRLAFVSNFDSSWESYLGDFIDQASSGLTAVWSNTSGYPPSHFLAFAGSNAGDRFKAWSHHIQVRTPVWYSAYPNLSITEINDATLIRRGLADAHAVAPADWLARLS